MFLDFGSLVDGGEFSSRFSGHGHLFTVIHLAISCLAAFLFGSLAVLSKNFQLFFLFDDFI
jgi:hypothetical protein